MAEELKEFSTYDGFNQFYKPLWDEYGVAWRIPVKEFVQKICARCTYLPDCNANFAMCPFIGITLFDTYKEAQHQVRNDPKTWTDRQTDLEKAMINYWDDGLNNLYCVLLKAR